MLDQVVAWSEALKSVREGNESHVTPHALLRRNGGLASGAIFPERREDLCGQSAVEPKETIDMTTNPKEPATDAVNRTAQEILAALQAKDAAKVNSYYAPGRGDRHGPPGGQGRAGRCPRPSGTILRMPTSR